MLNIILHSEIIGRSKHKLNEIVEDSRKYVVTKCHHQAIEKLERIHSVIITGSPGVGKTTLADQLCQLYTAQGYEFCFIESSLNEAEGIYKEDLKQIFYFDDFLGRNFLLALTLHQDSHIINFIGRVARDKNKRFILTSRTNVLNQGKRLSDLFDIKNIDRNEYELSISKLTDIDKARILYNHIWFGNLDESYIDKIYEEKRYFKIIKHSNFNPRLISFITDSYRLSRINPDDYWNYINETLSNPKDIWRNVFDVQIDEICRHIVIAVSLHGRALSDKLLKNLYLRINASVLSGDKSKDYEAILRLLVGSLLNRNLIASDNIIYNLFNPSIADFVISNYLSNHDYISKLLLCLRTPESISNLKSLMSSNIIDDEYFFTLLESQLIELSKDNKASDIDNYKLKILSLLSSSPILSLSDDAIEYI
ncbi:hypothetical protein ACK33D_10880 [Aeromonas hydrophila]|uniref:nSTAND3 domain-containing NTPase n=1 Tax=Aeromonas hydrophila TaxID=644 RepID=UPI0039889FBC